MKATDHLRTQHRELEQLFDRIETTTDAAERMAAAGELRDRIAAHWGVANAVLYPACFEILEDAERVRDLVEGHALVGFAAHRLGAIDAGDPSFDARLRSLREVVERHVQEEEDELLAMADEAIDEGRLEAMGERIDAEHGRLLGRGSSAVLVEAIGVAPAAAPRASRRAGGARRGAAKKATRASAAKKPARASAKRASKGAKRAAKAPGPRGRGASAGSGRGRADGERGARAGGSRKGSRPGGARKGSRSGGARKGARAGAR
jgi:hypothetical protein